MILGLEITELWKLRLRFCFSTCLHVGTEAGATGSAGGSGKKAAAVICFKLGMKPH